MSDPGSLTQGWRLALLGLVVLPLLHAQGIETSPLRAPAAPAKRSIEGRVLARDGASVSVSLLQRGGGGVTRSVVVDAAGRFVIDVTDHLGPAVLRFAAPGSATEIVEVPEVELAGALLLETQVLDRGHELVFRARAGGAAITATAFAIRNDGLIDATRALVDATADDEGQVRFAGLPADAVWIELRAKDCAPQIVLGDPLSGVVSGGEPELRPGLDLLIDLPAKEAARFTGEITLPVQVPGRNRLLRRRLEAVSLRDGKEGAFGLLGLPPGKVEGWLEPVGSDSGRKARSARLSAIPGGAPLAVTWTERPALPELQLLARPDRTPLRWQGLIEDASGQQRRWRGGADLRPLAADGPVKLTARVGRLLYRTQLVGPFEVAERIEREIGEAPLAVDVKVLQGSPRAGSIDRDPRIAWRRDAASPWIVVGRGQRDPDKTTRIEIPSGFGQLVLLGLGERVGVPLPVEGAGGERLTLRLAYDVAARLEGVLANDRRGAELRGRAAVARLAPAAGAPWWQTAECPLDDDGVFRFVGRLPGRRSLSLAIDRLAPHVVEDLDVSTRSELSINGFDLASMVRREIAVPPYEPVLVEALSSEEPPRVRLGDASGKVTLTLRPHHRYRLHGGWHPSVQAAATDRGVRLDGALVVATTERREGVITSRGRGPALGVLLLAEPGHHPVGGPLPFTLVRHERGEWQLAMAAASRVGLAVLAGGEALTRFGPFDGAQAEWTSIDIPEPSRLEGNMIGLSDRPVAGAELFAWPERDRIAPAIEPPPLIGYTDRAGRIRLPPLPGGVTRVVMRKGEVYRDHLVDNEDSQQLTNEPLRPVADYGARLDPVPFARWYAEDGREVSAALEARRALNERLLRVVLDHRSRRGERGRPAVFAQQSPPLRPQVRGVARRLQLEGDTFRTRDLPLSLIPLIGDEVDPGRPFIHTRSDGNGGVDLAGLQAGTYLLLSEDAGTRLVSTWQVEASGPVTARLEFPTVPLEIHCRLAGSDENLEGVHVAVERVAFRDGRRIPVAAARAARVAHRRTGERGRCNVVAPVGEALRIRAWRPAQGDVAVLDLEPLGGGLQRHRVALRLEPGFRVEGEVRSSGRHPLPGAWLRLLDADGRDLWGEVVTDSEGRFRGPPVPISVDYRLEARSRWITPWARTVSGGSGGVERVVVQGSVVRRSYISVETPEGRPIAGAVLVPAEPDAITGVPPTQALPAANARTGWAGASRFVSGPTGVIELESFPTGISSWKVYAEGFLPVDVEIRGFWPRRRVIMERSRKR